MMVWIILLRQNKEINIDKLQRYDEYDINYLMRTDLKK